VNARPVLLFALVLLLGVPAFAQDDTKGVERSIKLAADTVGTNRWDQGLRYLEQAEAKLGLLSDASKATLQPKIDTLRATLTEAKRAHDEQQFLKRFERQIGEGSMKSYFDGKRWDTVRRRIDEAAALLKSDDAKVLGAEARAKCEATVAAVRERLATTILEDEVADVEKYLQRCEGIVGGADRDRFWGNRFESSYKEALKELKDVPQSDPRVATLTQRIEAVRAGFDALVAELQRESLAQGIQAAWTDAFNGRGDRSQGWESEPLPTYETWRRSSGSLGMEKTEARYVLAVRLLNDGRYEAATSQLSDDPRVQEIVGKVEGLLVATGTKLHEAAATVLDGAENDGDSKHTEVSYTVERLISNLERFDLGVVGHDVTMTRARALVAELKELSLGDAKARADHWGACVAAAEELWPDYVDAYGAEELDPEAALSDPKAWVGKQVRIEGRNRAGWEYRAGDFDHVVEVDGVPVGCTLDPDVARGLEAMGEQSKIGFQPGRITDVVAIVESPCEVEGILGDETFEGIQARIVALRAGPHVLAANVGSNFGSVEGLEDVSVSAEGVSAGGWGWLCVGFACCMLTALLAGGGGFFLYSRQQAAAAGAAPLAADGPLESPPPGTAAGGAPPPAAPPAAAPAAGAPPAGDAPPAAPPAAGAPPAAAPPPATPPAAAPPPPPAAAPPPPPPAEPGPPPPPSPPPPPPHA